MLGKRKQTSSKITPLVLASLFGHLSLSVTFTAIFFRSAYAQEDGSQSAADLLPVDRQLASAASAPAPLNEASPNESGTSVAVTPPPEPTYTPEPAYTPPTVIEPALGYEAPPPPLWNSSPAPVYTPKPWKMPESAPTGSAPTESAPIVTERAAEPSVQQSAPAPASLGVVGSTSQGCAALLDPTVPVSSACGGSGSSSSVASSESEEIESGVNTSPSHSWREVPRRLDGSPLPPARQVTAQSRFIQGNSTIPPARLVKLPTRLSEEQAQQSVQVPSYLQAQDIAQSFPSGYSSDPVQSIYSTPLPPSSSIIGNFPFTVVKSSKFSLRPITGVNPLKWLFKDHAMMFPLPIPVAVSSAFGWRIHPISGDQRFHSGIDLGAPSGTPVLAAYDGKVLLADYLGGYGLSVLLDHAQGQQQTRYAHLSEIFVKPGQRVSQGDVIGSVGSTGNSTGPHLHFETLEASANGMIAVDPTPELKLALMNFLANLDDPARQAGLLSSVPLPSALSLVGPQLPGHAASPGTVAQKAFDPKTLGNGAFDKGQIPSREIGVLIGPQAFLNLGKGANQSQLTQ